MRIEIVARFRPFSHLPGAEAVLPGSFLLVRACPAMLSFRDLRSGRQWDFVLRLTGPVKEFTLQQDVERGRLFFWGIYREGYIRLRIAATADQGGFELLLLRGPKEGIEVVDSDLVIKPKKSLVFGAANDLYFPPERERLFLGISRKQDSDLISRREDLREILPLWFLLGQMVPKTEAMTNSGTLELLAKCAASEKDRVTYYFTNLYRAGFRSILSPRLNDDLHQGFNLSLAAERPEVSLTLLTRGYELIRSLFIFNENDSLALLPKLPKEFHAGRLINVNIGDLGSLDMEWSKKRIRRMVLRASRDVSVDFSFRAVKKYRFRQDVKQKGLYLSVGERIEIKNGGRYFFDNFRK